MKLLLFINILFSNVNAKYSKNGLRDGFSVERRSQQSPAHWTTGVGSFLLKPYLLNIMNSRAIANIKKTGCFPNMFFLATNPDLHYMMNLPLFGMLWGIPNYLNFWKNLKFGPSATKGKIHLIKEKSPFKSDAASEMQLRRF